LKTRKISILTTFLVVLLASAALPLISASANDRHEEWKLRIRREDHGWKRLETDIVTVLFPADGRKPIFIWWYTKEPDNIYVVKYQGLIEYFSFQHPKLPANPEFYKRKRHALAERLHELFIAEKERDYEHMIEMGHPMKNQAMMNLSKLRGEWPDASWVPPGWHPPYLPFSAGTWEITEITNVTDSDNKVIGVSFAFVLKSMPIYHFKFAENNIMIRVRFYNTTVKETVPDTGIEYKVHAGEMKMDLVIDKWQWNSDVIKPLMGALREVGVEIPDITTRLALWINLASINKTKLDEAKEEPPREDHIEKISTAVRMKLEGEHVSLRVNQTMDVETEEKPIFVAKRQIKVSFANETTTLAGFFRFVSEAKVTDPTGAVSVVPVKAAYISGGAHMRLYLGYPYFGNSSLEHDPSIGLDASEIDTTPQYTVEAPSDTNITPLVLGRFVPPLVTWQLAIIFIGVASIIAIVVFVVKWKRKVVNVVGTS
jgi:hypothetical protein